MNHNIIIMEKCIACSEDITDRYDATRCYYCQLFYHDRCYYIDEDDTDQDKCIHCLLHRGNVHYNETVTQDIRERFLIVEKNVPQVLIDSRRRRYMKMKLLESIRPELRYGVRFADDVPHYK